MSKHYCPDCGSTSLELTGEGEAKCEVEDDQWGRWFVEQPMEVTEVTCNECGYRLTGDRVKEFGL